MTSDSTSSTEGRPRGSGGLRWNAARCLLAGFLIGNMHLTSVAEDSPWMFELNRVAREIDDGNYQKALIVAETFGKELERSKAKLPQVRLRQEWLKYDQATAVAWLMVGMAERFVGNYRRSAALLEKSYKEFSDLRMRLGPNAMPATANAANEPRLSEKATDDEFVSYLVERIRESLNGTDSDPVLIIDQNLLVACDGLGAIAIDSALPLKKSSLRSLKIAESYYRHGQEIRDRGAIGASLTGAHANQQVSFLRNYGRLFLKLGELKLRYPDVAVSDDAEVLFDRASDYFSEADYIFSNYEPVVDSFRRIVHEGNLETIREELIRKIAEANTEVSRKQVRDLVDVLLQWGRRLSSAHADLQFNQAELELARVTAEMSQYDSPEAADLLERLDAVEQRLLEAADDLALVSAKGDHPLLVICYSELIALEAIRAQIEGRPPDEEFSQFLTRAQQIITDRQLADATIEAVYFRQAKDLWDKAAGLTTAP
jgi:hypothetical protein